MLGLKLFQIVMSSSGKALRELNDLVNIGVFESTTTIQDRGKPFLQILNVF